jgi:hypothetical protein
MVDLIEPQTFEEQLAVLNGEDLSEFRSNQLLRAELAVDEKIFINQKPSLWPSLIFNWDLSFEGQRFALDGFRAKEFKRSYPEGFRLAWVSFADFDKKLCHYNRRDNEEEVWSIGEKTKTAGVIAYVARNLPITPLLINVNSEGELCLNGGNHRYAVLKFSGADAFIPVYYDFEDFEKISSVLELHELQPDL